ncbi:hypothetical protein [Sodalis ligni]|uniref:Uncharacterized protein n=1 Tax=Sodalis ligni TaxID=2697027 RepID=A0A4R1NH52_9GAMM|nr:hypothetical protein [Sodalis ligni]TCL06922.1 hypothetical protein EZJ58_5220 [Sodalis ligni]
MTKSKLACLLSLFVMFATPAIYANQTENITQGASSNDFLLKNKKTDDEIRKIILKDYLTYHVTKRGPCPCPDMRAKGDSRCGARSAWSRKENKDVLCYNTDVTKDMIADWREHQEQKIAKEPNTEISTVLTKEEIEIEKKVDDFIESFSGKYDAKQNIKQEEVK